jgi:glycogen synthase
MKILLSSHLFLPSIGGIETVSANLAKAFVEAGNEVRIVTQTPSQELDTFAYQVFRCPTWRQWLENIAWCDVYFQNNISLQALWPLVFSPKPLIIAHHIWISRSDGTISWKDKLKSWLLRFARNISISKAIAKRLGAPSTVIPNAYNSDLFRQLPQTKRDKDLIFLGRLVSDKGVDLLIEAFAELKKQGVCPQLSIVGDGPDRQALEQQVKSANLENQVVFLGMRRGDELVELLNKHQLLVIPSRWEEPFGMVALEGIACGCVVLGSEGGGLKEAIGECGQTFKNGDVTSLRTALADLLAHPETFAAFQAQAQEHLARYQPTVIAAQYLEVFQHARKASHPS